jgi:hypothetical protein
LLKAQRGEDFTAPVDTAMKAALVA